MRFIIILVLFSVIAYASSNKICQFEAYDGPKEETWLQEDIPELTEEQPKALANNFGDSKAGCTLTACRNYCLSRMRPPFKYTCCGTCCACIKQ
jgi:hypothetical protein